MSNTFLNEKWEEIERTRCQIYTRVMWYHRPVISFNLWKKSEFYSRIYFEEDNDNENFINEFNI